MHGHVISLNTVLDLQISISTDVLWAQWAHCPKKNRREILNDVLYIDVAAKSKFSQQVSADCFCY